MVRTKLFLLIFTVSLTFSSRAEAIEVFRCFGEEIRNGDTTYSVLKKCGEPAYKEILSNEGCDKEEKWHYDCIGRGYVEELIFKKGILIKRRRGERSKGTRYCK